MCKRIIKVTVCNVPIQLSGDVLAVFLSDFRDIEDFSMIKSSSGMAHGDYSFTMCLNRVGGSRQYPHTLDYEDQVMMVVVEGRRLQCWHCKQLGHFSRSFPQKTTNNNNTTVIASNNSNIINDSKNNHNANLKSYYSSHYSSNNKPTKYRN